MPLIANPPKDRVILGLMTFGPSEENGARITDLETFNKALDVFQSRGYSEVDTARVYIGGEQEAHTGKTGWKERGLTLATKVKYPNNHGDNTAEKVIESVEKSLKDLGTDCIDVRDLFPTSFLTSH
jgi:aflatoxin B1 aldehyde reductase